MINKALSPRLLKLLRHTLLRLWRKLDLSLSYPSYQAYDWYSYLSNHTEASERFTTWWGNYTEERHAQLLQQYTTLSTHNLTQFTYDCSTCNEPDAFAFVYPDE